jgi:hypothetical protein
MKSERNNNMKDRATTQTPIKTNPRHHILPMYEDDYKVDDNNNCTKYNIA